MAFSLHTPHLVNKSQWLYLPDISSLESNHFSPLLTLPWPSNRHLLRGFGHGSLHWSPRFCPPPLQSINTAARGTLFSGSQVVLPFCSNRLVILSFLRIITGANGLHPLYPFSLSLSPPSSLHSSRGGLAALASPSGSLPESPSPSTLPATPLYFFQVKCHALNEALPNHCV